MVYLKYLLIVFVVFALTKFFNTKRTKFESLQEVRTESRDVYTGAWVHGFWDDQSKTLDTSVLSKFEYTLDKKMAVANIFTGWDFWDDPLLLDYLNEINSFGWTPMVSSNPMYFEMCPQQNESIYKVIARGDCDEYLQSAANNLKQYGKPILLRFAWEMNLPDMYWSIEKTNSTPSDFVEAWKHMHTLFKENEVKNVLWVLSFLTTNSVTVPYKELFPGDQYVDWVALDGYNWGNSHDWSGWQSFSGVYTNSYKELTALTNKPLMLSEVNSAPQGGDKAAWLRAMLIEQIPKKFPNVEMVIFFNENKEDGESVDWRIEKDPEYIKAVKEGLSDGIYKSTYP